MKVSMYKFINLLISFYTRDKVFVKQSFYNFIVNHVYRCARFNLRGRLFQILRSVSEGNVCKELKFNKSLDREKREI